MLLESFFHWLRVVRGAFTWYSVETLGLSRVFIESTVHIDLQYGHEARRYCQKTGNLRKRWCRPVKSAGTID